MKRGGAECAEGDTEGLMRYSKVGSDGLGLTLIAPAGELQMGRELKRQDAKDAKKDTDGFMILDL